MQSSSTNMVMGTHLYPSNDRESMALSLDSMYHEQHPAAENSRQHSVDRFHPFTQKIQARRQYFQPPHEGSFLSSHEMYQAPLGDESKKTQIADNSLQLPPIAEDGIPGMKSWVARHYYAGGSLGNGGGYGGVGNGIEYGNFKSLSSSMSPGSQSTCVGPQTYLTCWS